MHHLVKCRCFRGVAGLNSNKRGLFMNQARRSSMFPKRTPCAQQLQSLVVDLRVKRDFAKNGAVQGVTTGNRGTIPRAPNHCGGRRKLPTMSQVLPSIQRICFWKTSGSTMGGIKLASCPGRHLNALRPWHWSPDKLRASAVLSRMKWRPPNQSIQPPYSNLQT